MTQPQREMQEFVNFDLVQSVGLFLIIVVVLFHHFVSSVVIFRLQATLAVLCSLVIV